MALIALVGGIALYDVLQSQSHYAQLYSGTRGTAELGKATSALWQLRYGFPQFLVLDDAGKRQIVEEEARWYKEIDAALEAYAALPLTAAQRKKLDELRVVYRQYIEARPRWFQLMLEGKVEEAKEWRARTTTPFGAGTVKGFGELLSLQAETADRTRAELSAQARLMGWIDGVLVLFALLAALGIVLWIRGLVTGPVAAASAAARRIADGDLSEEIPAERNDGVGALLVALRDMQANLRRTVTTIQTASDSVGQATREIAQGHADLSSRTEEQATSLEQTAASMEEMTATVAQNEENAQKANQLAK